VGCVAKSNSAKLKNRQCAANGSKKSVWFYTTPILCHLSEYIKADQSRCFHLTGQGPSLTHHVKLKFSQKKTDKRLGARGLRRRRWCQYRDEKSTWRTPKNYDNRKTSSCASIVITRLTYNIVSEIIWRTLDLTSYPYETSVWAMYAPRFDFGSSIFMLFRVTIYASGISGWEMLMKYENNCCAFIDLCSLWSRVFDGKKDHLRGSWY